MISFILCLIFSVAILVIFRLFSRFQIDNLQAILFSYIVSALAAFLIADKSMALTDIPSQSWFIYTLIIGTTFFIGFNLFALSTQKAGLAITSVSANISVIIPVGFALMFYGEKLNYLQITGLILAIAAIFLVFKPKDQTKYSMGVLLFPLSLFLINGINNTLMKQAEHLDAMQNPMLFLGLLFSTAFIVGLIYITLKKGTKSFRLKNVVAAVILGLANFSSTYFFLNALSQFESSVFFPIYNLSFISFAALVGVLAFKEKLQIINWIGIILAIFAIILITI